MNEHNKPKFVSFFDEELNGHYGLLLADEDTVVCACCGGTFSKSEDVTIFQSCGWHGDALEDFIKETILGL